VNKRYKRFYIYVALWAISCALSRDNANDFTVVTWPIIGGRSLKWLSRSISKLGIAMNQGTAADPAWSNDVLAGMLITAWRRRSIECQTAAWSVELGWVKKTGFEYSVSNTRIIYEYIVAATKQLRVILWPRLCSVSSQHSLFISCHSLSLSSNYIIVLRTVDRSFCYASPCLWNHLPPPQHDSSLSISDLPRHTPVIFLCCFITIIIDNSSLFHSIMDSRPSRLPWTDFTRSPTIRSEI